jgi:hypothetical protein
VKCEYYTSANVMCIKEINHKEHEDPFLNENLLLYRVCGYELWRRKQSIILITSFINLNSNEDHHRI